MRCLFYSCQLFQNVHFTVYLAKFFYPIILGPVLLLCFSWTQNNTTEFKFAVYLYGRIHDLTIQQRLCGNLHAWLHTQDISKFQAPPSLPPSTCTTWMDCSSVWIENSVCNRRSLTLFTNKQLPEFKPFPVPFCIMQGLLTPQFYLHLIISQISNLNLQNKQKELANNSRITCLPILKQSLSSMQVIWPFPLYLMWHIFLWLRHAMHSLQHSHLQTTIHQAKWWCSWFTEMDGIFLDAQEAVP